MPFRALTPLIVLALFVFGGCLVDPEMPVDNTYSTPRTPAVPLPAKDSLAAPVDTVTHHEPGDSVTSPPAGSSGGLERPTKKGPQDPPDPPGSPPPSPAPTASA